MATDKRAKISRVLRSVLHPFQFKKFTDAKRKENDSIEAEAPFPLLPLERPRPLTPAASPDSIGTPHMSSNLSSPIFTRLLPELRRLVLIEIFGERTLHLDLRLTHPHVGHAHDTPSRGDDEHGHGRAPLSWYSAKDYTAPKVWRWWSGVCHRSLPFADSTKGRRGYRYPMHDTCMRGDAGCCHLWSLGGSTGVCSGCAINAMGWLLTCRQAYVEGIDVLYSTNTFFIGSQAVLDALFCPVPRTRHLILPERLATITSLELTWDLLLFGRLPSSTRNLQHDLESDRRRVADRQKLTSHLSCIGDVCPNLRSLVLTFTDALYLDFHVQPRLALEEISVLLLRPIAEAVVRLPRPQKRPVVVELPYNVFVDVHDGARHGEIGLEASTEGGRYPVWLRCPLSPRGDETIASGEQNSSAGFVSNPRDSQDECGDRYTYYLIKEGVDTNLFWDYLGVPQLRSHMMADANIIM